MAFLKSTALSRFHILRSQTRFRRAVLGASGLVFMFCALVLIFSGTVGVGSRFHVVRARTRFRRYRGRVPFSWFALRNSFSTVPRALGPFIMFCAPGLVFDGTEGVGSHFHVLRFRTRFGGTVSVGSRFHVLRSRARFRRYRGRRVLCSLFCAPELIFGGSEGVGSCFPVFAPLYSFSAVLGASGPVFFFCAPGLFSAVPRASVAVFMFCVLVLIFGGTEGVGSLFHVLRAWTHFRRYRGRFPFS
jgi:hypothetical protein